MKLLFIILAFSSCSKVIDYSYLNTDRRPFVVRISERYTDPPLSKDTLIKNKKVIIWIPYKIVLDTLDKDLIRASDYLNISTDTIFSTCSIDKIDSNFRIEIRKYNVYQP